MRRCTSKIDSSGVHRTKSLSAVNWLSEGETFIGCYTRDKSGGNLLCFARSTARAQQPL
jgi:hypothetical protein